MVSEMRRSRPHGAVRSWISEVPREQLFVSAVTIGEIQAGIEITRQQDPARAEELEAWLAHILELYQYIPMGIAEFREWARLKHGKSASLSEDAMIAATAVVYDLTVVTRNTRDFIELGVACLNPFKAHQ